MAIYVSSGAFESRNINTIIDLAYKNDIRNIEFAPGLEYHSNTIQIVKRCSKHFDFLIHNYFPTPLNSFALNLASSDDMVIKRSMGMCYDNIDLVYELGKGHYSIHCGYCFETDGKALGNSQQMNLPRIPYRIARDTFVKNVRKLCMYAKAKDVVIAIENNVMAEFAYGQKELYLGVDTEDMIDLMERIDMPNAGILLDLAHAKISDNYLHFGLERMIKDLEPFITEVHVSDNAGKTDDNEAIRQGSDIYNLISLCANVPVTIEAYSLSLNEIKEQIAIVNEALRRMDLEA